MQVKNSEGCGAQRELTPVLPAPTLAPSSAARNAEQQPDFQKSRRQEIRSCQVAGPLQTEQQLFLLGESAERDSSAEISAERGRASHPWSSSLLKRSSVGSRTGAVCPEVPLTSLPPSPVPRVQAQKEMEVYVYILRACKAEPNLRPDGWHVTGASQVIQE